MCSLGRWLWTGGAQARWRHLRIGCGLFQAWRTGSTCPRHLAPVRSLGCVYTLLRCPHLPHPTHGWGGSRSRGAPGRVWYRRHGGGFWVSGPWRSCAVRSPTYISTSGLCGKVKHTADIWLDGWFYVFSSLHMNGNMNIQLMSKWKINGK